MRQPSAYSRRGLSVFSRRGFFISAAFVGNAGFDPLQLANSDTLVPLRHAELKFGRLAMLSAVGWPASEVLHPKLVELMSRSLDGTFHGLEVKSLLSSGLAPSLLNGGIFQPEIQPALGFFLTIGAMCEIEDIKKRARLGLQMHEWTADSVAGDNAWDPLSLSSNLPVTERFELQQAEMLNGRLAMLAVVSYCAIEAGLQVPIFGFTPGLLSW